MAVAINTLRGKLPIRALLAVVLALVVWLVVLGHSAQAATVPLTSDAVRAWADSIAQAWMGRLGPGNAGIQDPLNVRSQGYGTAMLGYAALRAAVRSGDQDLEGRALHALTYPAARSASTPFDLWAVTVAYRYGQDKLADDPQWQNTAHILADYLARFPAAPRARAVGCDADPACYSNWRLVDAQATQRLLSLRLDGQPGSRAADPQDQATQIDQLINQVMPTQAGPPAMSTWIDGDLRVLSDPPSEPLAYHVFSLLHLQRLDEEAPWLLGDDAHAALLAAERYLLAEAAPDATVSWMGRSMQQSWTLLGAIDAAVRASVDQPALAEQADGLASQAWQTLQARYPVRHGMLALTPSMGRRWSYQGMDHYAGLVVYNGLCLLLANDIADALEEHAIQPGSIPAAQEDGLLDDHTGAGVVAWRHGPVWLGLQTRDTMSDSRYRAGLLALQIQTPGGWENLLPAPVLAMRTPGNAPRLDGHALADLGVSSASDDALALSGSWDRRYPGGWTFRAKRRGVTWQVRAPARHVLSAAWTLPAPASLHGRQVRFGHTLLTLPAGAHTRLAAGSLASATDPVLVRLRWSVRVPPSGRCALELRRG